ncbi:hypothetical protein Cni_G02332 [Canna indica]|uniref:Reverse transcriptase domain-containing protein n=1 Tax=Canna indica TaxID=4628 RepID=A0AAQ3JQZ5_9LILI|nr:hypothetical protein Cni_G02332 [Canna indica]
MATRLNEQIQPLIDNSQCAFLKGKGALDSYMAAHELINLCKQRREEAFFIKLDMAKAFDSVDCEFATLINGVPEKWFRHKRGLRQGDPLSPYFFLLVAHKANGGLIKGIEIGDGKEVVNLVFTDDFMVFTRADESDLINFKLLLYAFELASGLSVNYDKSGITHIRNDDGRSITAASILGCQAKSFPISYLGLPLKNTNLSQNDWNVILEKIL